MQSNGRGRQTDLEELLGDEPTDSVGGEAGMRRGGGKTAPLSDTVLDLDQWSRKRGQDLLDRWRGKIKGDPLSAAIPDELKDQYTNPVVADAHGSLFEPVPEMAERQADEQRAAWWKQFMDTPEYQKLHRQTCMNTAMSALAAKHVCDEWAKYAQALPPSDQRPPDTPAPGSDEESLKEALCRMRSTTKALKAAQETVDDAKDMAEGIGMTEGSGGQLNEKAVAKYFSRVRNSALLQQIMRMAGRMRHLAQALQRSKTIHGRDDMVGVELSGDLARLVPSELAQLVCGIPELELLALDRVARRQAISWQFRGVEKLGKGPIVVCVDESSSMRGDKIIAAKALALTMAWVARHQKRWAALVSFSRGRDYKYVALRPNRWNQVDLFIWMEHFFAGGTSLDVPIDQVPFFLWPQWTESKKIRMPRGKTDMVIITDGLVDPPWEQVERYRQWAKTEQVTTYGIVVGQSQPGGIKGVCDRYWTIPQLDLDNEAVRQLLSV